MKLATTTEDFCQYTDVQTETLEYFHGAGFHYLDYSFCVDFNRRQGFFSKNPSTYLEEVRRQCEKFSMQFVQAHAPMGQPIVKNQQYDEFISATKRSIEVCSQLGIRNIVVHSGYEKGLSKDETFEKNRLFYLEILHFAEKFGVNVLTENFNKMNMEGVYWIDSAADQRELIDYVNHPLFHACWDTGHGNLQEIPQDESLRILGKEVYALHIHDNLGESDSHFAPYFGTMNPDSLMHGLREIRYKGYFTFEANNTMIFNAAGNAVRRKYEADNRAWNPSVDLQVKAESLLYDIGKYILEAYDCFEE